MSETPKPRPFLRPLFRQAALERRGQTEDLDGLLRVTAPHEWIVLSVMGVVLACVVLWGFFGSVERSVTAPCVLVEPGEYHSVRALSSGIVTEVAVEVGDKVRAGEPLYRLRLPELERQVAAANAHIAILETDREPSRAAIAFARAELAGLEAALESSRDVSSSSDGTVIWLDRVIGELADAGDEIAGVHGGAGGLHVLSYVEPEVARQLSVGLRAQIARMDGPGTASVDAIVSEVSSTSAPPPEWLTGLSGFTVPDHSVAIIAELSDPVKLRLSEGDLCRIRVTLSRQHPISLIALIDFLDPRSL